MVNYRTKQTGRIYGCNTNNFTKEKKERTIFICIKNKSYVISKDFFNQIFKKLKVFYEMNSQCINIHIFCGQ